MNTKIEPFTRGSEWRRWDLHIHTPESYQHEYSSWDNYISELEKITDVSVLGINDYFTIDGYKKILDCREKGKLNNFDLILPNIEFRLNIFIPKKSSGEQQRRLNFHVLFSDKVSVTDIEEQFLQTLDIIVEGDPVASKGTYKLTKRSIEGVGQSVKKYQESVKGKSDYFAGCKNITVDLKNILESLQKKCFNGKYVIILPVENWDNISWEGQDYLTRKTLVQTAHIVFCGQEPTINWCLGKGDLSVKKFEDEFGSLKPSLHGSDAHSIEELCKPKDDKFCWVKADPTFEGLKQIIFEPTERVKIQKDSPEKSENKLFMENLNFSEASNFPISKNTNLSLNKNMVAIIGGRGSGKSALAESIAFCFDKHAKEPINKKERFIPYFLRNGANFNLQLSLGDRDGNLESVECELEQERETLSFPFQYLGQNKIEDYASDDGQIHNLISNTILESSKYYSNFRKYTTYIDELKKNLLELNNDIKTVEEKLNIVNIDEIIIEKKTKEEEKRLLSSQETKDIINQLTIAKKSIFKAQSLGDTIYELTNDLTVFNKDFINKIDHIEILVKELNLNFTRPNINCEEIIHSLDAIGLDKKLLEIETEYEKASCLAKEKLEGKIDVSVEHITYLTEDVDQLNKDIQIYKNIEKSLDDLLDARRVNYEYLVDTYIKLQECYQKAIDVQHDHEKAILKDVNLKADLNFKVDELYEMIFNKFVDKRKCRTINTLRARFGFSTIDEYLDFLKNKLDDDYVFDIFLESSKDEIINLFFRDHFELTTNVELKIDKQAIPLDRLSLGQKGTVILKLFLATSNSPIIFDQPEDHLDNDFIFSSLVPTFIEAKKKRQIIVVTHNANLVVNGDAEQVIIANYEGGNIKYVSGSIENPSIRHGITKVLEGGQKAFEKREQKYGFTS